MQSDSNLDNAIDERTYGRVGQVSSFIDSETINGIGYFSLEHTYSRTPVH